jgi:multiple sugar transport system substrate-binding protein/sn-glycerol 3-phosphate transport system substrate-binding protein
MRKLSLLLLALLVVGGAAFAQDDLSAVDPSGETVVYWHQFSGAQLDTMAALVADFNATNEWGITVEPIAQGSYNDIRELMNAAIVSGDLPNIVAGYANDSASYFRDGGSVDLNRYVSDPTWGLSADQLADFNNGLIAANSVPGEPFNGALLAWPHQSSAQVFIANNTLLESLGFSEVPRTIEDFTAAACAAAESTGPNGEDIQGFPITTDASMFESFVAAFGGRIFDGESYSFTSDAAISAFQLYKDLYDQGCGYIPAERFAEQTDFALGLNPFFASSTAGFTFIIAANTENNFQGEWTANTFPHTEGNEILQVFVPSIILVPSTPEKELASWLFLEYLASPEAAAAWSEGTGYFNPVPSTASMIAENAEFSATELAPYFNTANDLLNNPEVTIYSGPNVPSYGSIRGLVSEAIANVTSNGMDVAEVAAALEEQANSIHAEGM